MIEGGCLAGEKPAAIRTMGIESQQYSAMPCNNLPLFGRQYRKLSAPAWLAPVAVQTPQLAVDQLGGSTRDCDFANGTKGAFEQLYLPPSQFAW